MAAGIDTSRKDGGKVVPFWEKEKPSQPTDSREVNGYALGCGCLSANLVGLPGERNAYSNAYAHPVHMSRVDSLPERAKEVLQAGSVIEREFPHELIDRIMGLPEKDLLSHLSVLKDSELLYERGVYPQSSYIFKHALTREVVYDSILTGRKKKLHEEIGNAIEQLYKDSLREHYEVLAEHYIFAENYPKGAEYSRLAGRKAEKAVSFSDAIAHARKAVTSLEQLPRTEDVERKIIDARVVLGLYLSQLTRNAEAKVSIDPIINLAIKHDYKKRICQIYTIIGTYDCFVEENNEKATETLTKAINISEEIGNIVAHVLASYWFGCALGFNCEFEKAESHFQKALDINVAASNLWGSITANSTLAWYCHFYSGKINQGFEIAKEALRSAEESGDIFSKALAYTSYGKFNWGKGFLREAGKHLLLGLELCERIQVLAWITGARFILGELYFELGDFTKSKEHYEKGISVLENYRLLPSWAGLLRLGVARSKVMNKEKDVNPESLAVLHRNNKVKMFDGWIQRYMGEIFLNFDDHHFSEAEHWIQGAIETDRRNGMMLHPGKDHALCAELFKRKGDRSKFQEHLGKAINLFKECGADGWLKIAEEELATLS